MTNLAALTILLATGVVACAGARAPQASASSVGACQTSSRDDACDRCTAAKCCAEETACMVDVACKSADDALDACEAKAERSGHGLPECYDTFSGAGSLANGRAQCIRSHCAKACLGTSASS